MAIPQARYSNFNPLGSSDSDRLEVQTDSQGYHAIKVYNEIRDNMWSLASGITLSNTRMDVLGLSKQLYLLFLKANSIWKGIEESAKLKAYGLKLKETKTFKYENQMEGEANLVKRYIQFFEQRNLFEDEYGKLDKEFEKFAERRTEAGQLEFIKDRIQAVIAHADETWGTLEAKIGFGMPLKIAEERELYFRGR